MTEPRQTIDKAFTITGVLCAIGAGLALLFGNGSELYLQIAAVLAAVGFLNLMGTLHSPNEEED